VTLGVYVSGRRSFGAAVAEQAASGGYRLTGAASPPESPGGAPDRLRAAALRLGVPWTDSARLTPETVPDGTDVIIAAHSHAFIGARTRARASVASVGYHPSLLPLHRGRDAIRWTIRDGDKVTGGTVYHLTGAVDGGPIAAQDYALVPPGITPAELWRERLFPLGLRLIASVLADIDAGLVVCVPQDEALATWEPSWERPRLHRPELPELPSARTDIRFAADPALLRR
jgi:methionyl-tRNA formyltransferase